MNDWLSWDLLVLNPQNPKSKGSNVTKNANARGLIRAQATPPQLRPITHVHLRFESVVKLFWVLANIEGSRPEWCISSMMYSRDIPFWSETLYMSVISVQHGIFLLSSGWNFQTDAKLECAIFEISSDWIMGSSVWIGANDTSFCVHGQGQQDQAGLWQVLQTESTAGASIAWSVGFGPAHVHFQRQFVRAGPFEAPTYTGTFACLLVFRIVVKLHLAFQLLHCSGEVLWRCLSSAVGWSPGPGFMKGLISVKGTISTYSPLTSGRSDSWRDF